MVPVVIGLLFKTLFFFLSKVIEKQWVIVQSFASAIQIWNINDKHIKNVADSTWNSQQWTVHANTEHKLIPRGQHTSFWCRDKKMTISSCCLLERCCNLSALTARTKIFHRKESSLVHRLALNTPLTPCSDESRRHPFMQHTKSQNHIWPTQKWVV